MPVSEGLLVNGITTLAGQISKRFIQKYALPLRMRKRLSKTHSNEVNSEILDALQRAIGNFRSLTPATNNSLLDLANSNLLEHLIAIFGSTLDHSNALSLLEYIHRSRGSHSEADSVQFAADLATCLKTVNDSVSADTDASVSKDLFSNWRRIMDEEAKRADAIISNTLQKLKDKSGNWIDRPEISAESVAKQIEEDRDPLKNYVNSLKKTMNSVDVHGASGDVVQVPLDEIYVDVPVSFIDRKRNFNVYQDLRKNLPRQRIAEDWEKTLDFINTTVLLGDPGGGKSTLSKKLCLEGCNRYLGGQTKLPIYIQLRTYISKAADDDRLSLKHYVVDFVSSTLVDGDTRDVSSSILYHLRIGAVFFVADGLDEVLTSANRARVVQELATFKKEFPLCQIMVTSRYVGYETQPLEGFTHLGVDFLNDSAIEQIYKNVSSTVLKRCDSEIDARLSTFLIDARKKARELIRSPLLLTLIVIIYDKKSEIPDNRASLYSFCADLLFDQWDKYRDIIPDLPERYRLFDLFKHLSALLYENEEYGGTINKDDLEKEAREFFKSDYIDNREGRSAAAAKHMVDHLTGRAWILHEVGENIFEFTHRTFMEYFYAKYLDTEYEDTTSLVTNCLEHVIEGRRTLPTHLALQIRTNNKRAASSKVANALTDALAANQGNAELLDFCLDSLGYILPKAEELSRFISALSHPALFSQDPSTSVKLLCTQSPLRNNILNIAVEQLDNVKTVDQVRVLEAAFQRMRSFGGNIVTDATGQTVDISAQVIQRLFNKQASSPYVCKLAFDLDCEVNWNAARKFAGRLWDNSKTDTSHYFRMFRDSQRILESAAKFVVNADTPNDKYLKLARAVYPTLLSDKNNTHFDVSYMRYYRNDTWHKHVEFSADLSAWREDNDAQEIYAFALMFYAETHIDFLQPPIRERLNSTLSDLADSLDSLTSPVGDWCRAWLKEQNTLVLYPDYHRHHSRQVFEFAE